MNLVLQRLPGGQDSTPGMLWVEGACFCLTLEDEHRDVKVPGDTRIPAGAYKLLFRREGGMHEKYSKHYGKAHFGMIELQNVRGFTYVYVHVGNFPADTAGCILVGEGLNVLRGEFSLTNSGSAYNRFVKLVAPELLAGRPVSLHVLDPR